MYAEKLSTPHPTIADVGVTAEPLLESVRLKTIEAAYQVSEGTYDDTVEAAYAAADLVRQTLRFKKTGGEKEPMHPDTIAAEQYTNCHGYSVVASEVLEAAGIAHWIGYANQHSFLLLQEEDGTRTNIIDTPERFLHVDISKAIGGTALLAQPNLLVKTNRLRGDIVNEASGFSNKERAFSERPWMSFTVDSPDKFRYADPNQERRAHNLILRSYYSEIGRKVLRSYGNFKQAVEQNRIEDAHELYAGLDSVYPDVDRRNGLYHPIKLIRGLGRAGLLDDALADIARTKRSIDVSEDLYMKLWPIHERRHLGLITGRGYLIDEAVDLYKEVAKERRSEGRSTAHVDSVIRKAERQAQRYNKEQEEK